MAGRNDGWWVDSAKHFNERGWSVQLIIGENQVIGSRRRRVKVIEMNAPFLPANSLKKRAISAHPASEPMKNGRLLSPVGLVLDFAIEAFESCLAIWTWRDVEDDQGVWLYCRSLHVIRLHCHRD